MDDTSQATELEIRRKSQELAVAWRKGRAAFVLDSLDTEAPLRAALIATLIHDALARWDPYDSKWSGGFRRALLTRSQGGITPDEVHELEREYSRRFGSSPPPLAGGFGSVDPESQRHALGARIESIRAALTTGQPIIRERPMSSPMFMRPQTMRR